MIRQCTLSDLDDIHDVVNDAAMAYRGVIAPDCWKEPYMSADELRREVADGVAFWGAFDDGALVAVMGLQQVADVALVRHAYTRTASQGMGRGRALLDHVTRLADRPLLVGTWTAATWAVRFYEHHGFRLVTEAEKAPLLRRYWRIGDRQVEESVVLGDARWFASGATTR